MLKRADDTHERILKAAEENFLRYGYGKTTVADIARASDMSPANVYRFFDSKAEIIAAIADIWLAEFEGFAREIAVSDAPAADRLRRYVVDLHRITVERYLENDKIHETCLTVITEHWPVVQRHIDRMREILGLIIEAGKASGEFQVDDVQEIAETVKNTLVKFHHPAIVAQCQHEPLEEQAKAVVELLIRGLAAPPS